jgi:hypothetical protein
MPKLAFAVLAIGLCGSLGCNAIADIHDPIPRGSTTGPGPTPLTPPGTPPGGGDASKFVGSWSGSLTSTLSNCSDPLAEGSGTVDGTMKGDVSPNGFRLTDPSGCTVEFKVDGNLGTAIAGAPCILTKNGVTSTIATTAGSFTLASDTSGALRIDGSLHQTDGASTVDCELTQTGQFTKTGGT